METLNPKVGEIFEWNVHVGRCYPQEEVIQHKLSQQEKFQSAYPRGCCEHQRGLWKHKVNLGGAT